MTKVWTCSRLVWEVVVAELLLMLRSVALRRWYMTRNVDRVLGSETVSKIP
jgi:hypothetical protein